MVIILHGSAEVALILTGHTPDLIDLRNKRITLYRGRGIRLGSAEILEIQFRDSPEKIWLRQIRFRCNRAVKVLDGKHIIIEIERILPYFHYLLGVDLRPRLNSAEQQYQQNYYPDFKNLLLHTTNLRNPGKFSLIL